MKKGIRRILTAVLAGAMTLSLAACGTSAVDGDGKEQQSEKQTSEWVYVPEYKELTGDGDYWSMKQVGDYLYYQSNKWDEETGESSSSMKKYSLLDGSEETIPLTLDGGSLNSFEIGEDGSVYAMIYFWSNDEITGDYKSWQALAKYDAAGNEVYNVNLADMQEKEGIDWFGNMTVDEQGRVYITCDTKIALFDESGNYCGLASVGNDMNSWINEIGRGADGKIYACCYSYDGNSSGYQLNEIDFDKKGVGATYSNFPSGNGNGLVSDGENSFLVQDGTTVFRYDMTTQASEKLFNWLDSDIDGQYVNGIGVTSEGKILAIINDWNTNEYSVAVLTKTPGSEVARKETIVVGTLGASQELQSAAVAFNKANENYRVTIKQYIDNSAGWTETTWSDAITNMNNDLTSANCPDIIDLSNLNAEQLTNKGVLEDITPYLENSTVLSREDYIESILAGYTYNNVLVGIPKAFSVQTIVGNADDLGTEMGWSLDDMIAYADAHPDANLFDYNSKSSIMYYCMMYNEDTFIDWATGKCNFNSPEFISLLEFVNRFPEEVDYDSEVSTPTKIQNGEVLLDEAYLSGFDDIQMYNEIFGGKANFIGFPTMDGSVGCALYASNVYAIAAKSSVKEGAWAFIESYLAAADTDRWSWGFPSNKVQLDAKIEEATKVETYTWTDEDGVEHEEVSSGGGSISYQDGWTYEYHTTTKEEVDQVLALFDVASPAASQNSEIMTIISEEAEAFYQGQKSAADVATIIQSRVQIYVDENS